MAIIKVIPSIQHSGTLGMRWGARRYQNEDGTYTEAGKARRRKNGYENRNAPMSDDDRAMMRQVVADHALEKNYKKAINEEFGGSAATDAVNKIRKLETDINKTKPYAVSLARKGDDAQHAELVAKARADIRDMSNEDLQKIINRINLENNYIRATVPEIKTGQQKMADMFEIFNGVTAIAATGITIAAGIKALKTKKS